MGSDVDEVGEFQFDGDREKRRPPATDGVDQESDTLERSGAETRLPEFLVAFGGLSPSIVALALLLVAVGTDFIWTAHVATLAAVYVLVTVVNVLIYRERRAPTAGDAVVVAVAVAVLVAVPLGVRVGPLPESFDLQLLYLAFFVGQWAAPIALTVPLGIVRTRRHRELIVVAHLAAITGLLVATALVSGGTPVTLTAATPTTVGFYVVAAVGAYPAAEMLRPGTASFREAASTLPLPTEPPK